MKWAFFRMHTPSLCVIVFGGIIAAWAAPDGAISPAVRTKFDLAPSYTQAVMVKDFPVVGSAKVHPAAMQEAALIVGKMLDGREDVLTQMAKNKVRLGIMAVSERTCDLPEHADLAPRAYWNKRARGLGASRERPCVSCGEENLLNLPGDPYPTESIMVHEFAHAIHLMGVAEMDTTFNARLEKAYNAAKAAGLWKNCYAMENSAEYWAEAVQSWFDTNRENDKIHNHVNTRAELIAYDSEVAALCREVFGENTWKYVRADHQSRAAEPHLKGLDRAMLPKFAWTAEETAAYKALDKKD